MKFLIADDHALFRQGIRLALQNVYPALQVSEASTVAETLRILSDVNGFDLVLYDLLMPDADTESSMADVVQAAGPVPVVVVSAADDWPHVRAAYKAGVRGFISKASTIEAMNHKLSLILAGETYFPIPAPALADTLLPSDSRIGGSSSPDVPESFVHLSPRQLEVAALLAQGYSNKQIAAKLGVIEGTVKMHIHDIMQKLGVRNRTQAALLAIKLPKPEGDQG